MGTDGGSASLNNALHELLRNTVQRAVRCSDGERALNFWIGARLVVHAATGSA